MDRRNHYQWDNVHGFPPHVSGNDNRRTSRSHPALQPPVQDGDNPLDRPFPTAQSSTPGQAQPFDTYGAGQSRQPSLQYAPSTHPPQYPGPQGQIHSASYQDQRYQFEPPNNAAAFSMPNVPGYNAHPSQRGSPRCRYPNCGRPVAMDRETQGFDEYCSQAHMENDLQRGVPPCPVCNRRPCRINGNYCGPSCESQDTQRRWQSQPQQHQQYSLSNGPPSGAIRHAVLMATTRDGQQTTGYLAANNRYLSPGSPHAVLMPTSRNAFRSAARGGQQPTGYPEANNQYLSPGSPPVGGQVRCSTCGREYPPRQGSCPFCGRSLIV